MSCCYQAWSASFAQIIKIDLVDKWSTIQPDIEEPADAGILSSGVTWSFGTCIPSVLSNKELSQICDMNKLARINELY